MMYFKGRRLDLRISENIKIEYIDKDQKAYIKVNDELKCVGRIINHTMDWMASVQLNEFGMDYFNVNRR